MPIPENYKPEIPLTAKDRAFAQIQEWIIDGTLMPGEKINDMELARAIGVSRTPVREAIMLLSMQGLVSTRPGVATYVEDARIEDMEKLLPPSAALQSLAAEIATPLMTEHHIALMEEANQGLADALEKHDFFNALKFDTQFHRFIINLCDNSYLTNALDNLQAHVRRLFYLNTTIISENSVKEHAELIQAIREKDPSKASTLAKKHWTRSVEDFMNL